MVQLSPNYQMSQTRLRMTKSLLPGIAVATALAAGCSAWPFHAKERTSIITPGMRAAAVREMAAQAEDADTAEQQRLTEQLAMQIRTEPDPLVRKAIQETLGEYSTPMARDVLIAGLDDTDLNVRIACCQELGEKGDPSLIPTLRNVLEQAEELDVRLAAVDSLGKISTPESVTALAIALKDPDPAMQYAGVEALKTASGQNFGNDVNAWQQFVDGKQPQTPPQISVAERVKQLSPF